LLTSTPSPKPRGLTKFPYDLGNAKHCQERTIFSTRHDKTRAKSLGHLDHQPSLIRPAVPAFLPHCITPGFPPVSASLTSSTIVSRDTRIYGRSRELSTQRVFLQLARLIASFVLERQWHSVYHSSCRMSSIGSWSCELFPILVEAFKSL
jgi:hypothetical protein